MTCTRPLFHQRDETCHRCLFCGLPAQVDAVFIPKTDLPGDCYIVIPYHLCARCFNLGQPTVAMLAECLLIENEGDKGEKDR